MFSLCVHEEVYLKKDALQDRPKSAIGSEFIDLSTHSWDHFFNISIFLFDCYMTSVVSCTILGLFSLILDLSVFVFKSNLELVLSSKGEWSDIMQYIQLNPIWKNRCVCSHVVSRSNTPVLLSANKHKLIWLLTVLHKNNIYILMMKIALARQEEEFLLLMSQFLFRCVYVNGVCAHFCTRSATGISSTSAKA